MNISKNKLPEKQVLRLSRGYFFERFLMYIQNIEGSISCFSASLSECMSRSFTHGSGCNIKGRETY